MNKLLIALLAMGLVGSLAQAQGSGPGPGPGPGEWTPPEGVVIPEEIVELRTELEAAKAALHASREDVLAGLVDATAEDIAAALAAWREDPATVAAIAEIQDLAQQLRDLVQEYRPDVHFNVPPEIEALRVQLREQRQTLAQSRREAIAAVEDPTEENIRAALEQWRVQNQEQIQATHELAVQVREWFRANRPDRPPPEVTGEMLQRRQQFRENTAEMRQLRNQLMDPTLTEEERQQLREQQRQLLQEQKSLMRNKRLGEGDAGGDRRPGS